MQVEILHHLVEANGKTIRQNNLEKQHRFPVGTLVEVRFDTWFGDGACWKVHARLWVVEHTRDCDGTPLYSLSRWNDAAFARQVHDIHHGFDEKSLTPIEITERLREGWNALEWED
jgi:hypothetical protein